MLLMHVGYRSMENVCHFPGFYAIQKKAFELFAKCGHRFPVGSALHEPTQFDPKRRVA